MRIYTKTGDEGETGLFGGGRVLKSDPRVEAYGAVDELNSVLGYVLTRVSEARVREQLSLVQADLFAVGAHLATPSETRGRKPELPALPVERVAALERWIDSMEGDLPELRTFILPGGSEAGALVHMARAVARRAERRVIALGQSETVAREIVVYLNRLSDYLFVLARSINHAAGVAEQPWTP